MLWVLEPVLVLVELGADHTLPVTLTATVFGKLLMVFGCHTL